MLLKTLKHQRDDDADLADGRLDVGAWFPMAGSQFPSPGTISSLDMSGGIEIVRYDLTEASTLQAFNEFSVAREYRITDVHGYEVDGCLATPPSGTEQHLPRTSWRLEHVGAQPKCRNRRRRTADHLSQFGGVMSWRESGPGECCSVPRPAALARQPSTSYPVNVGDPVSPGDAELVNPVSTRPRSGHSELSRYRRTCRARRSCPARGTGNQPSGTTPHIEATVREVSVRRPAGALGSSADVARR